jgi:hypothetical protein
MPSNSQGLVVALAKACFWGTPSFVNILIDSSILAIPPANFPSLLRA